MRWLASLIEKVILEKILEKNVRISPVDVWRKSIADR